MKKVVSLMLALILATGGLLLGFPAAPVFAEEVKTVLAPYTIGMPVLDGDLTDTAWSGKVTTPIATDISGASAHSARFGTLWDFDYLYVAAQIEDADLVAGFDPTDGIWGHADLVSLFFDSTIHESSPYLASDLQIGLAVSGDGFNPRIQLGGGVVKDDAEKTRILNSVFAAYQADDNGWSIEIAIPWEAVGIDPLLVAEIGFDIGVDDVSSDGGYEYLYWETRDRTSFWNDTAGFGRLVLSRNEAVESGGDVIFFEDFESATVGQAPNTFKGTKGAAPVVADTGAANGKVLALGNSGNQNEFNTALARLPKGIGDYLLEADFSFVNVSDSGRWTSLMYRVQNEDAPYFQFATRQNGGVEFAHRTASNTWDVRWSGSVPAYALNSFSHLEARVVGNTVQETVNGQTVVSRTDAGDYLAGNVGAQSNYSQVYFDNFKVTRIYPTGIYVDVPETAETLDVITPANAQADYSNSAKGIAIGAAQSVSAQSIYPLPIVHYYSSDPSILEVRDDGTLLARTAGEVTLTARFHNAVFQQDITITDSGQVPEAVSFVVDMPGFEQNPLPLPVGTAAPLSVIPLQVTDTLGDTSAIDAGNERVTVTSSDPAVLNIQDGTLSVAGKGYATLSITVDQITDSILVWGYVDEQNDDKTWFLEDFESTTLGGFPASLTVIQGSGAKVVEVNGNKLLSIGSNGEYWNTVLKDVPEGIGDYTIEADITFLSANDDARWISLMFRAQDMSYPYFQMAGRRNATASNGIEFAHNTPAGWGNWNVRETASYSEAFAYGKSYHWKAEVSGNKVREYINDQLLISTNNAGDYLTGDVGFQVNNASAYVDNFKVSLLTPAIPDSVSTFAAPKILSENMVGAPTVVGTGAQSLEDIQALANDAVTSSVHLALELEGDALKVYSSNLSADDPVLIGDIDEVTALAAGKVLTLFDIESSEVADAFATYVEAKQLKDTHVTSTNATLLTALRARLKTTRATLISTDGQLDAQERYDLVYAANAAWCKSVIIPLSAADRDTVEDMQQHLFTVWVVSDATPAEASATALQKALTSGANGILSTDTAALKTVADTYTSPTLMRTPFIIGHRGNPSNAPENTMASYHSAYLTYGSEMIETDVDISKDGVVVVLHDGTLARTTNIRTTTAITDAEIAATGRTRDNIRPIDLTLEQLKRLDAGSWYGSQFADEEVLTLAEILGDIKGKDVLLFLETKAVGLEEEVIEVIESFGPEMLNQVIIISFNVSSIQKFAEIYPQIPCGNLNGVGLNSADASLTVEKVINTMLPMNATYNPSYDNINQDLQNYLIARGMATWPWTINNSSSQQAYLDYGVNGITTDYAQWTTASVVSLDAAQSSYEVLVGEQATPQAVSLNKLGVDQHLATELVVLEGADNITVSDGVVTGVQEGSATIMLKALAPAQTGRKAYALFTQPIAITVGDVAAATPHLSITGPVAATQNDTLDYTVSLEGIQNAGTVVVDVYPEGELEFLQAVALDPALKLAYTITRADGTISVVLWALGVPGLSLDDTAPIVTFSFKATGEGEGKVTLCKGEGGSYVLDDEGNFKDSADIAITLPDGDAASVVTEIAKYFDSFDFNRDGKISIADLTYAQAFYMASAQSGGDRWVHADERGIDVDANGVVDVADFILIIEYIYQI
jgi:glycerophosphoryl diester phosphodiesterase